MKWIWQKPGLYHSEDGTRRLIHTTDDCWWATPMHKKPGAGGFSLGELHGPYRVAADAGELDRAPGLGDHTFEEQDK